MKRWVPDILPLLEDDDPLGVDSFATHHLPLDEAPAAYQMFQEKKDGAVKIVFRPGSSCSGSSSSACSLTCSRPAKIDGANHWQVFWHVALPLTRPALVVTAIFEFQAAWTDLMRSLIYLRDSDKFTVPRGLKSMRDQFGFGGEWRWEYILTAGVITTVPMIMVFLVAQKQIRRHREHRHQGLVNGGRCSSSSSTWPCRPTRRRWSWCCSGAAAAAT